ncbi:MAG: glycosyl transferase family 1 [Bacteroidetes bacterium HGW-Bacteroidetes-16]|jgi:glycosyltransferase involved in cell wall biosynthesis|nr:MAG: glycosyl transferase family 1 [Bacteroidetes bacterium HGW-Bacteroidetes-16]
MIKNRDIVVVGLAALDSRIGSNVINLAHEFAKNNRVLYVNYPIDRFTMWRDKNDSVVQNRVQRMKSDEPNLVKLEDNFWTLYPATILESISQLPANWLFDILNKINNKRLAKEVNKAIKRLVFTDIIVFNDTDMFRSFYLKENIGAKTYVYYTRDNMIAVDFWKTQGIRIEAALMAKSDLVVANSTYLAELAQRFNPNSFYVGQGCDVSIFDKKLIATPPIDMEPILALKKPIVGYIGVLFNLRLDIEVLEFLAKSRPDYSFVFVGPEDEAFSASELHRQSNVFFLGSKQMEELPAYLNYFDVALNPQKLNEVTIGNYPRKIDEYLAMGKPTVATKTEAMSVFAEYTYLAATKEDYLALVDLALKENSPEKEKAREKFARGHTWEANVNEIYKRIEQIEKA